MAVPNDEIYEKYLQKAIREINDLGDEIARAAGERAVPVLGSGHPLADIMLLKYGPQASEIEEGVAFYGRAGQAVLQARCSACTSIRWPSTGRTASSSRAQSPTISRVSGSPASCTSSSRSSSSAWARTRSASSTGSSSHSGRRSSRRAGELQCFTPTIDALVCPDIDASLDEQPLKTAFWSAFKPVGAWWAELPPY